jgi:HEAT repeat protein
VTSSAAPQSVEQDRREPPFSPGLIEEMLKLLIKALRAHQLYLHNNPIYQRAIELLRASFAPIWAHTDEIALAVTETELRWFGRAVLVELAKSSDSIPWICYKDGVRELKLLRGFEADELPKLLEILQRVRKASPEEDDLLTLLWGQDFASLRYRYVDLGVEQAAAIDETPAAERPTQVDPPQATIEEEEEETAESRAVVNLDDFDSTLYFLDERELDYLRSEIANEYAGDLRRNVLSMVLDIFEGQADVAVREEIIGILDNLMLHLLSGGQYTAVAFLLRESIEAAKRAKGITDEQQKRLRALPARLSTKEALSQLVQSLDESPDLPPQSDLDELFTQLRGEALETVFARLGSVMNPQLRTLLEKAAQRLAASNTGDLVRLITSIEENVALEAIRRAAALKTAAAVTPLGKVLGDRPPAVRLAAVQALTEIASPSALTLLERAIDDSDRDVRIATARALVLRGYRAALPRITNVVTGKAIREADLTEKMALFEAYGALCGAAGIGFLDGLLNGKGFLGRREDPELRACAAMALGRIKTDQAMASLRQAGSDKDVVVRNAISKALRGAPS